MPFPRYNFSYIKGTLEPTLLDPPRAPLRLFNIRKNFGFFSNITIPNTPFAYFTISSLTLTPITPNHYIH